MHHTAEAFWCSACLVVLREQLRVCREDDQLQLCGRRMLWSFSRDGGVPFHRLWSSVNPLTGTPINSVWCVSG